MERFKKILVIDPADGTEIASAMDLAVNLATRNNAALTVTSTVEAVPRRWSKRIQRQGINIEEILVEDRRRSLGDIARKYQTRTLDIVVAVDVGVPVIETVRRVIEHHHDLVITPEDAGPAGFVSRTKQLLRRCPCPLWVVRPSRGEHMTVLAAVDPTEDHDGGLLSQTILELASSVVLIEGGELHVLHAWAMDGEAVLRSSPQVSMSSVGVDQMVENTRDEHKGVFDEFMTKFDLSSIEHSIHLLKGDPRRIIPAMAVQQNIDLIVMGTVARTGIAGFMIGNTAETVLDSLDCSVLAVKPQGFVVPGTQAAGPVS